MKSLGSFLLSLPIAEVKGKEIDNLFRCKGYAVTSALAIRSNVGST